MIPPTVNTPPPNTSTFVPSFSQGGPSWVQPVVSPPSWGYTYPRNQPPMVHQAYQLALSAAVYPGIPYPGNVFVPWGQPNWSNVPSYGGAFVNTTGGYGGPPGGPPPRGPLTGSG